jgi:UDP-glucose 4-epimerase
MTWLITGGAGYIGAHVVRTFTDAGEDCVVLDDLSAGIRSRVPAAVPFVQADVLDAEALDRVFADYKFEGVVHLAGKKSVPESTLRPDLYKRINTDGTQSLLDACLRHGVRHVVFSSTAAVYGVIESDEPVTETAQVAPINPYGETKLAAEHAIEKATTSGELDAIAFRYFNVGGAAAPDLEDLYGENLIPILRRAIASGLPVSVFGTALPTRDGTCIRDYIHVADLATAHLSAARYLRERPRQAFEVINLGTGTGSTVLEVIAAVSEAEGVPVPWVAADPRVGDPVASTCDASLAAAVLDWHPTLTMRQIAGRAE